MKIALTLPLVLLLGSAALTDTCGEPSVDNGQPAFLEHDALFEVDNLLLEPIPMGAEVDPLSDVYIAKMVEIAGTGGVMLVNNEFSSPVYYADETTPRYDVRLTVYGTSGYCGKSVLEDVPIPSWAVEDSESDAHMTIVDRSSGCVYDFWGYGQDPNVELKTSWWASALPAESSGIYSGTLGAGSAAGFSLPNGAVWPDEIEAGYIPHALVFGYGAPGVLAGDPVPPANHNDGTSMEEGAIPEGTHIQLDPELDLDTLDLGPTEKIIARALQEYGMYLVDVTGGGIRIGAVSGLSTYPNAWEQVIPGSGDANLWLVGIPVDRLRVLRIPDSIPQVGGCSNNPCQTYR